MGMFAALLIFCLLIAAPTSSATANQDHLQHHDGGGGASEGTDSRLGAPQSVQENKTVSAESPLSTGARTLSSGERIDAVISSRQIVASSTSNTSTNTNTVTSASHSADSQPGGAQAAADTPNNSIGAPPESENNKTNCTRAKLGETNCTLAYASDQAANRGGQIVIPTSASGGLDSDADADADESIQSQRQYSSSRLLLRFVVISLFVLLSLSLVTVYAIKFCLCHRAPSSLPGRHRQHHLAMRRPKRIAGPAQTSAAAAAGGGWSFLQNLASSGLLRRCNLIADGSSAPDHQVQQNNQLLDGPNLANLPMRLPLSLLQAPQNQQQQCSCFHPDTYSALTAGHNFTSDDCQQQRDCVWWCSGGGAGDCTDTFTSTMDGPFSTTSTTAGRLAAPISSNYERQLPITIADCHLTGPPPAYSDIGTNGEQRTPAMTMSSVAHSHQQANGGGHQQKNLLVKLNLNKTRVLSPDELMLLSRLIDVPIVVQQQQQPRDPDTGGSDRALESAGNCIQEVAEEAHEAAENQEETDDGSPN